MRGHIRLGSDINDLRDYLLVNDAKIRQRILANPMAAKLGQGAGKYDDLTNWSGWVMENWQAGLGKREADAEGFLYAELETRFQGQLCLPLYYDLEIISNPAASKLHNPPIGISDILTVSTTGSVRKLAFRITPDQSLTTGSVWVLLFGVANTSKVTLYTNSGGQPGSVILAGTGTSAVDLAFHYVQNALSVAVVSGTIYWVVLEPTSGSIYVPVYNHGVTATTRKQYNGSAWVDSQYSFFFYLDNSSGAVKTISFQNETHFASASSLYKWNGSAVELVSSGLHGTAVDMIAFGALLFIGYGAGTAIDIWDGASVTVAAAKYASVFAAWNGYLWRAYQNDVYYTADGTTWTGPIQIGPDGYNVTGMAGLGEDMYAATDEGLYKIGAGDLVFGVMRFNNVSARNGAGMLNHQGALFIPTHSDILRFGGAEIMSVNPMKDEGLPIYRQGRTMALLSHNYWLFALIAKGDDPYSWPILIAYNDQGWHYIGKLLQGEGDALALYYSAGRNLAWDADENLIWAVADNWLYRFRLPVDHQNPYKDNSGNVRFLPGGYMETPWFYSGLKEIRKDCESVYITGENISSSRPVKVYWKDDDSADWEYLGTVTSNRQELRWSDPDTRPNTRQIKLGIVMTTDDYTQTPRVDAIRLKFQNMVTDRWRWQLSINVGDSQEMLDSDLNIYTKEQQRAHLDTLIRSVGPILFEDVDGVQYEVKVLGASEQVERYEYLENAPNFTSVYSLTVEQATTTSYN